MSLTREITYSISEVEKMNGGEISQKQIRYWVERGYVQSNRNVCGLVAYHRFTPSQVELIQKIKRYLDHGYTLARAAELARNGKRLDQ